jgi:hypothetical protein
VFAGCGGLSLGLHKAGWEGLFAIERDPMAFDTLRNNMLLPDAPYPSFAHWPGTGGEGVFELRRGVDLVVPPGTPDGDLPVRLTIGGVASPDGAYLTVKSGQ